MGEWANGRKRTGIEPAEDSLGCLSPVLKTGGHTSVPIAPMTGRYPPMAVMFKGGMGEKSLRRSFSRARHGPDLRDVPQKLPWTTPRCA